MSIGLSSVLLQVTCLLCLFVLRLNSQCRVYNVGTEPPLPGYYQFFRGTKCLAQGHSTLEVGFEPRPFAPESDALLPGYPSSSEKMATTTPA